MRIRKRDDALCDTFHIYGNRFTFIFLLLRFLVRCLVFFVLLFLIFFIFLFLLKRTRLRHERIAQRLLQGHQQWTHCRRKPKIEVERVVDRIELTIREKIEILPLWIPCGTEIVEFWIRDEPCLARFNLAEFD